MRRILWLVVAAAALAASGSASATTWTVSGGLPLKKPPPGTPKQADVEQFAPLAITINAGDKILFKTNEGHTVTFPGATPLTDLNVGLPDPKGSTYEGILDAAGNPFYFDGTTKWLYNTPLILQPSGSLTVSDNSAFHGRTIFGAFGGQKAATATFNFPKPGVYRYLCLFHSYMRGTVVVRPKGAPVASEAAVQRRIATQIAKDVVQLKAFTKIAPTEPNTIYAGVGDKNQVSLDVFVPNKLTVPVGTTVTWVVKSPSQAHNLAFGPLAWLKKFQNKNDLFPFPAGSPNQVLPTFPYGSDPVDPATGAYAYDGTNHGNGVLITPQIDRLDSASDFLPIELPGTARVTFTKPGTYHYICQLHGPQMSGDIIVTG